MLKYDIVGFAAAAISPLAMTVGFILWGNSWKGNSYSLNVFKCSLAGVLFLIAALIFPSLHVSTSYGNSMIVLSSFIGIVVGDNTWLLALQIIGAKRVIVIDALKPFCAAFAAYFILGEPLSLAVCAGVLITSVGVVLVSTEKTADSNAPEELPASLREATSENTTTAANIPHEAAVSPIQQYWGFFLAAINVILDAFGSILTKQFGTALNTWEINLIRFGFAAVFMLLFSAVFYARDAVKAKGRSAQAYAAGLEMSESRHALTSEEREQFEDSPDSNNRGAIDEEQLDGCTNTTDRAVAINESSTSSHCRNKAATEPEERNGDSLKTNSVKWYEFPLNGDMSLRQWASVAVGVLFVTFLCPALANFALFRLPLSLSLTLNSLGPLYSIPLVYLMSGEKSGIQTVFGALLAVGGIALICW